MRAIRSRRLCWEVAQSRYDHGPYIALQSSRRALLLVVAPTRCFQPPVLHHSQPRDCSKDRLPYDFVLHDYLQQLDLEQIVKRWVVSSALQGQQWRRHRQDSQ